MEGKRRKRLARKRKHEATNSEFTVAQNNNRRFDAKARKEEEELSKDLFGDNLGFLKSLEEVALDSQDAPTSDSGVGDTEAEESNDESKRTAVWHDDEDDGIDVGSALDKQGRRLPNGGLSTRSSQYANLLQNKFQSIVGTPKWASLTKTSDDSDEELLQSCGHIVQSESNLLRAGTLEFKKVQDLNMETYNEGPKITTVQFHPKCTVALVAGMSGVASLYAVDGKRNHKLHSVAFTRYPIECGRFLADGTEALLGSRHAHFFSYDLRAAKSVQIPLPHGLTQCKQFEISPCKRILAVAGKWGEIHLLTAASKEFIATLKQNTPVTALLFHGDQLFSHSNSGEVTVWDMASRRLLHRWTDEGCLQGTTLAVSASGQLIATGSAQGVVNVYDRDTVLTSKCPKPRKSHLNLSTSIDQLQFNCTSEILGFSSRHMANSVRLLHVQSGTVFSNFPTFGTKLGRVNALSFSPNSGYAAFANINSTVALYRLKQYNNY